MIQTSFHHSCLRYMAKKSSDATASQMPIHYILPSCLEMRYANKGTVSGITSYSAESFFIASTRFPMTEKCAVSISEPFFFAYAGPGLKKRCRAQAVTLVRDVEKKLLCFWSTLFDRPSLTEVLDERIYNNAHNRLLLGPTKSGEPTTMTLKLEWEQLSPV